VDGSSAYLPGIAGAVGAAVALPLILRTVRANAETIEGRQVLRYARPLRILVGAFWACWLGLVALAIFMPKREAGDGWIAASLVVGFFLLVFVLHIEFFVVRVTFDESGVQTRSPWRRGRCVPWSDIIRVGFSPMAQWYTVQTREHGYIRLHLYLSGIESLLNELERRGVSVASRPDP
jgi:hypothetical protein